MLSKQTIDIAYCFFHQKLRVYEHSLLDWQRDDIEVAISDYVSQMNQELYLSLANGNPDYLLSHPRFLADLTDAVARLEEWAKTMTENPTYLTNRDALG